MRYFSLRSVLILCVITCSLIVIPSSQAGPGDTIVNITRFSASFPQVTLAFRAIGPDAQVLGDLTRDNIQITENNQPVADLELRVNHDSPVHVVFMLDIGYSATFGLYGKENIKNLLKLAVDGGQFQEGLDTVSIILRQNSTGGVGNDTNTEWLPPTSSRQAFIDKVNELDLTPRGTSGAYSTAGLRGVSQIVSDMKAYTTLGQSTVAVIYIGRMIEAGSTSDAASIAEIARQNYIRLYAFHTDVHTPADTQIPLQTMARDTGGQYLHLAYGGDNSASVGSIYANILAPGQHVSYEAHYRSIIADRSRQVNLLVNGTPAQQVQSYDADIAEPTVVIQAPLDNFSITRTATRTDDGSSWKYDTDSTDVLARISWNSGGYQPRIDSAELLANGVPVMTIPSPGSDMLNFTWQLVGIQDNASYSLQVQLLDEFGKRITSGAVPGQIQIDKPVDVVIEEVINETVIRSVCEEDPRGIKCIQQRVITFAPWIGLVLTGSLAFVYRRRLGGVAVAAAQSFLSTELGQQISKTILGGRGGKQRKVFARLIVLDGPEQLLKSEIAIYGNITTLGRDPERADVLLYRPSDKSSISGRHCVINHYNGTFKITDVSANGTLLNGRLLDPDDPRELKDGDELTLGDLARQGARLKFQIDAAALAEKSASGMPAGDTLLGNEGVSDYTMYPAEVDSLSETIIEPDNYQPDRPVMSSRLAYDDRYAPDNPPPARRPAPTQAPKRKPGKKTNGNGYDDSWLNELE